MEVRKAFLGWPVVRQLTGPDRSGRGRAVRSAATERIAARTILWGAGVAASPIVHSLGTELDKAGRVRVTRELTVPEGVTINDDPELLIVHVVSRAAQAEATGAEGESLTQPEVIKPERKEKEE